MKGRTIGCTLTIAALLGAVIAIFWHQQLQYLTPTTVPDDYVPVPEGAQLSLPFLSDTISQPIFLHFFNPDCPCSQFNQDHFRQVVRQYRTQANFYVIVQNDTEKEVHQDLKVTVVTDDGQIADACGVYATPQAVILNADRTLYYRGNYNKARYCTTRTTRFAELALQSAIEQQPLPLAIKQAGLPYGCNLPSDQLPNPSAENIFSVVINNMF
jgi:hypothetical protein